MDEHIQISEEIRDLQDRLYALRVKRAEAIRAAHADGVSVEELVKDCGVTKTAVLRIVKEGTIA